MSDVITRTLYRSLLRTVKPYTSSYDGPILCSLLYRNGLDHDDYVDFTKVEQRQTIEPPSTSFVQNRAEEDGGKHKTSASETAKAAVESFKDVHLSKEEARDLSQTYNELRQIHFQKQQGLSNIQKEQGMKDDNDDTTSTFDDGDEGGWTTFQTDHDYSYRGETKSPHIALYKQLLRYLFFDDDQHVLRCMTFPSQTLSSENKDCTMGQRLMRIIKSEFRAKRNEDSKSFSKLYTDAIRKETGFLALRELQKKLAWAESMGMKDLFHSKTNDGALISIEEQEQRSERMQFQRKQAAKDVNRIPTQPPSSYLQSGAFLVAHPMLGSIFSQSVICILQHTESKDKSPNSESSLEEDGIISKPGGGTYGLIINNQLTVGIPGDDPNRRRHRTLREVIRHDSLPEGVKVAFGHCPVRNGGPVNMSVQMLRIATPEEEEKLKIGGTVLPMVLSEEDSENGEEIASTAMYSDKAIYFGGDIIKAAQAVIEGEMERDSFSFVIGASCWELGQLEGEIARGYWLPCKGPPKIAVTGDCDHEETCEHEKYPDAIKKRSEVWLSMMCALGDENGRMANLIINDKQIEEGEACDEM